jgi:GntR family transcriptional regulator / MocR family aminotransferase
VALAGAQAAQGAATPARLVLGFGNVGERSITAGIAAVGDLLHPTPVTAAPP